MEPHTSWYLTLVNKMNALPKDYRPDLVEVQGGERVDKRIYDPLMQILEAAKEGNCGFIYGCRKIVINTVLSFDILEINHRLLMLRRKSGFIDMLEWKRRQRCMNGGFA